MHADTADFVVTSAPDNDWVVTDSILFTSANLGVVRGDAGNLHYGDSAHTIVNLGVACTTGVVGFDAWAVTISGGLGNVNNGDQSTIGGGIRNTITNFWCTIGGGTQNAVTGAISTIGGGLDNIASGSVAVVGGGSSNTASGSRSTVGGGNVNIASGDKSAVGGGAYNGAGGPYSVVGGGGGTALIDGNATSNNYSAILGGRRNTASGEGSIGGGGFGNTASASWSTVPGGFGNSASGIYSFAAGRRARARNDGSFVWADGHNASFVSEVDNGFHVRATGGVVFYTSSNLSTFVLLNTGDGSWTGVSSRDVKRNIRPVVGSEILEKVAAPPISRWSYKTQDPSIEHIGPMAQDFYRLFNTGGSDSTISMFDPSGVALAAIQELDRRTNALTESQERVDGLETRVAELTRMVEALVAERR